MTNIDLGKYKGLAVVLSSPSGGGKSSLARALQKRNDDDFVISISTTTRPPRDGEVDGVDYHFRSKDAFANAIDTSKIIEHTQIYNNFYGTHIDDLHMPIEQNQTILFDIDFKGAESIKKLLPTNCVSIFIMPPSFEVLRERLLARGAGSHEQAQIRIKSAAKEMEHAKNYDYVVINDEFETALNTIEKIIFAEKLRRDKQNLIESIKRQK